jgi:16S rRNA U516 pseudouridylate synthase RsuA-like enzyme
MFGIKSKSEARRLIKQGGLRINGEVVTDVDYVITEKDFLHGIYIILQKGKKNFELVKLEQKDGRQKDRRIRITKRIERLINQTKNKRK